MLSFIMETSELFPRDTQCPAQRRRQSEQQAGTNTRCDTAEPAKMKSPPSSTCEEAAHEPNEED